MKNKTLLIAAAALVAGVVSSEAQVYSANIVGYANVVLQGGYNLICNPLDDGNGNNLTNLIKANLPAKSSVTTWNTGVQGYNGAINGAGGTWAANTVLPPGMGFFVKNGTAASPAVTNTFVGSIPATGGTTTNALVNNFTLVGSQMPYGAANLFTDPNINLVNSGLAGKSSVTTWNTGLQGYNGAVLFSAATPTALTVGQAIFIKSVQGPTNWVETLP